MQNHHDGAVPRQRDALLFIFYERLWRAWRTVVGIAAALVVAGCGGGSYPVQGEVLWSDGTPATELAGGFVGFSSEAAKLSARGEINPDGSFSLSSLRKDDGLPPGVYQVIVAPPEPSATEGPAAQPVQGRRLLPTKYQSYQNSGLEITVEPKRNQVKLKLEKR
jgi:hypothetical protein